jgi:hypothetical protein
METMSPAVLLALAGLAIVVRLWHDALKARELALKASQRACRELDLQLLDETVALARVRLARDAGGRLRLYREYGFEFSARGDERYRGTARVVAGIVESIHLDHPDGPLLVK